MAQKTVEFVKVQLFKKDDEMEISYKGIKNMFQDIFNSKAKKNKGFSSLDISTNISPNDIEPKIVLDVFEYDQFLYGRLCKKKANNAILQRDYTTLEANEVFSPSDALKKGIEVFTYFYFNYDKGLVAIANAKDAPSFKILQKIFDNYNPAYEMKFVQIPNEDGVNVLYRANSPQISNMEFVLPSPDAEYLQKVLDLPEEIIADVIREDIFTATVILKPQPYHKLSKGPKKVREIIDILKRKKDSYISTVIKGSSEDFNSRNFDLHAKYFTYPIDVKKYHTVMGEKVEYTLEEITKQFEDGLIEAYNKNEDILLAISQRS